MEKAYSKGDRIVVNKLIFGPRIPMTPLSLPFTKRYLSWIYLPYFRLPGIGQINRGDVLVFNFPGQMNEPIDCRKEYIKRCVGLPGDTFSVVKNRYKLNKKTDIFLNNSKINEKTTKLSKAFFDAPKVLLIPQKGMKISLELSTINIYKKLIEEHENEKIGVIGTRIYVNGKEEKSFVFKQNYYFVLGDNSKKSFDSRFWGLLPENHIIGKVVYDY